MPRQPGYRRQATQQATQQATTESQIVPLTDGGLLIQTPYVHRVQLSDGTFVEKVYYHKYIKKNKPKRSEEKKQKREEEKKKREEERQKKEAERQLKISLRKVIFSTLSNMPLSALQEMKRIVDDNQPAQPGQPEPVA